MSLPKTTVCGIGIEPIENGAVRIALDGTVTFVGVTIDEASQRFWKQIAASVAAIQPFEMRRLRRALESSRPAGAEMEVPAPHTLGGFARRWVANHGLNDPEDNYDGFIGNALIALVDCFRTQGHSGASAEMVASAFAALLQDYDNPNSAEWGQFWMTPEGQAMRARQHEEAVKANG